MIGLDPIALKLDPLGRRELLLMEETELLPLRQPIARFPAGDFKYPFMGSDGANALDYNPLESVPDTVRLRKPEPPTPKYASPRGFPLRPKRGLGSYMRNLSKRAYEMIRRRVGSAANYAVPERLSATNIYSMPHMGLVNNVPLPTGNVKAEQFPRRESINLEPVAIPGTYENKTLGRLYRSALNFVKERRAHFGETGRVLESFYKNMIEELGKAPLKDVVHEYVHHMLEKLGINLEGEKNEAFTTYATDRIIGRSSTTPGTGYHALKKIGKYICGKLGMTPERIVEKAEYDDKIGPMVVKIFDRYWGDAGRKYGMRR